MELSSGEFDEMMVAINRHDDAILAAQQKLRDAGKQKTPEFKQLEIRRANIAAAKSWFVQKQLPDPWIVTLFYKIANWKNSGWHYVSIAAKLSRENH